MTTHEYFETMLELYRRKNADYGNNAHKTFEKFGTVAYTVRMFDKANRLDNLRAINTINVNESIADTIIDLGAYALMCAGDIICHMTGADNRETTENYMIFLTEESEKNVYEASLEFYSKYVNGGTLSDMIERVHNDGGAAQYIMLSEYMAIEYVKEMDKE